MRTVYYNGKSYRVREAQEWSGLTLSASSSKVKSLMERKPERVRKHELSRIVKWGLDEGR